MPTTVKTSCRSTYHDSLLFMAVLHRSSRPLRGLERPASPSQTKKKSLEKLRKECAVMMTHSFEKNYHTRRKADTERKIQTVIVARQKCGHPMVNSGGSFYGYHLTGKPCIQRFSEIVERFRAGHFTCKNTDWEKWREPIRKVEPETTDWALHTRIPVRIEPSHFLTAAECWSIAGSEEIQSWNFYFSVSFFFSFFPFVSGRWPDLGVLPRLQTCFQFIFLFIYLFIFFACHATVIVVTGFVLKDSSPLSRMFASK